MHLAYMSFFNANVRSFVQYNTKCYLFNKYLKQLVLVCNAMQCKKCINVILQCTTLDRLCKTIICCITYVISLMNMGWSQFGCAMQYSACIQPICYSSMHNDRSLVQCNAKCYFFNKHLKELVLVCNAMQCKKCIHVIIQCTTLDRFCNAMQHVISLVNMGKSQFWCAMQCKKYINVILQCTTLDRFCNAMQFNAMQHVLSL